MKDEKDIVIKSLYPDYVFIKTVLDKPTFEQQYRKIFEMVEGIAALLEIRDIYVFDDSE